MLSISTTKFLIAELAVADYNFHRWTSKPTEYYSVNSKPPELHTIMKKCNGTGMVLKICETKNNVWKRHILSIQNSIDNHIKTTRIKPNFASLSRKWTESSHKIGKCQRQACLSVGAFSILWLFEGMTLGLPTSGSAGGKMRGVAALRIDQPDVVIFNEST